MARHMADRFFFSVQGQAVPELAYDIKIFGGTFRN